MMASQSACHDEKNSGQKIQAQPGEAIQVEAKPEDFQITEAAKQQVIKSLAQRGKGIGIRVGIKTTGCSGLAYILEYVDTPNPIDLAFPIADSLSVYIDPKAFQYLRGSTMDFIKRGLNSGFEFINPNEKARCGCGESFTV